MAKIYKAYKAVSKATEHPKGTGIGYGRFYRVRKFDDNQVEVHGNFGNGIQTRLYEKKHAANFLRIINTNE